MFWRLLRESALVGDGDDGTLPEDFADLAESRGIAFADLYVTPGSDAAKVRPKPGAMPVHENLVERMAAVLAEPPRAIVLVSKTVAEQFLRKKTAHFGKVAVSAELDVPPWLSDDTELWVLPSTSARAPMKWEKRLGPFKEFAAAIQKWPWPADSVHANCHPSPISATIPNDDKPDPGKMSTNG
jgi:G:T/U-mismatch repair DNA glycosylase